MNAGDPLFDAVSANAGSAAASAPSNGQAGQGRVDVEALLREHENLKTVLGQQGQELGGYRKFIEDIGPLAEKLEANPAVYDMIMSDKLTDEIAKLVADGKISATEGKQVAQAHAEVKKDAKGNLINLTPEEVETLVERKLEAMKGTVKETMSSEVDGFRTEQAQIADAAEFIANTPDFGAYSEEVNKYLEAHPDLMDVSEAYYNVKGRAVTQEAMKNASVQAAEIAKNVAVGSAPGSVSAFRVPHNDTAAADRLFGREVSPTSLL